MWASNVQFAIYESVLSINCDIFTDEFTLVSRINVGYSCIAALFLKANFLFRYFVNVLNVFFSADYRSDWYLFTSVTLKPESLMNDWFCVSLAVSVKYVYLYLHAMLFAFAIFTDTVFRIYCWSECVHLSLTRPTYICLDRLESNLNNSFFLKVSRGIGCLSSEILWYFLMRLKCKLFFWISIDWMRKIECWFLQSLPWDSAEQLNWTFSNM